MSQKRKAHKIEKGYKNRGVSSKNRPLQFHKRSQYFISADDEAFPDSHDTVIGVYDDGGNVIQTHEHKDDLKEG